MSNESSLRNDLVVPAGTTIKFNGVAFSLTSDTQVQGLESSLELARNYADMPKAGDNLNSSQPISNLGRDV